jgi:hypothetical protein
VISLFDCLNLSGFDEGYFWTLMGGWFVINLRMVFDD